MDRFSALADPSRRRMVELLSGGSRSAGALGAEFELSAPAVSQHLKVLREAGLVRVEVDGQRRIYSLDPTGLAEMHSWLNQVRGFWTERLDRLQTAIASEKAKAKGEAK
jgi:DNA-binding transcriptional ArsR family regulator